jgi:6-phosphogluconolactonase
MFTRRRFLLTLPALAALPRVVLQPAQAQSLSNPFRKQPPAPPPPTFVYLGTDTDKGVAKGIYLSHFDVSTGHLTQPSLVAETLRPSYLALSPSAPDVPRRLYAVNAVADPSATVTSFAIDPASGALRQLNRVTSAGAGPCYISLDATGESAFVANYVGSTIATYRVQPDGSLSEPVDRLDYKEPRFGKRGPNVRQDVPHPHSVHLSPDNRFLLVNDLGSDAISVFTVDPATARLGPPALFTNDRPGSGPRHIAFHPNGRWVYSINELDSTIDRFLWTTTSSQGLLVIAGPPVKTIAPGFRVAKNTAAEVAISDDGGFLYASNRGEDTLVVFTISPTDGALSFMQRIPCGGKTPRHFTLDPSGRWLLCGNQDSATVTILRRDKYTGRLAGPVQTVALDSVMFTMFA